MTRLALTNDRGLQAERTALAWTRTALAIAASGVLVALRDHDVADLGRNPLRTMVIAATAILAAGVFILGKLRCQQLIRRPGHSAAIGRRYVPGIGLAVIVQGALVVLYLAAPGG